MKTFTTSLLVNRLLTSVFTLAFIFSASSVIATTGNPDNTIIGNMSIASGIEYASLTATATEKSVFIDWVTASEQNNSHFEVERSSDMKSFKTVAIVLDGFAAEGTGKTYKFKEDAGDVREGKTVYYRLKQIGTDNVVHYSAVIAVKRNTDFKLIQKQDGASVNPAEKAPASDLAGIKILLSKQATALSSINILAGGFKKATAGIFTGTILMSENAVNNTEFVFA